jgi:L-seryl-tRNA(Ser) seleniumtransferase
MANLKNRVERLAPQMALCSAIASAVPVETTSFLGGGAVPAQEIGTWGIALAPKEGSVSELSNRLRACEPAIFSRVQKDRVLLDLRTVFPSQDITLVQAVESLGDRLQVADAPPATAETNDS